MEDASVSILIEWFDALLRSWGWTLALLVARLLPVVLLVPALGGMRVPSFVRMGVLLSLVLASWPAAGFAQVAGTAESVAALAWQALFGVIVGAALSAVFEAVRGAGNLTDQLLGRGSMGAGDPFLPGSETATGSMYALLFLAVYAASDSHLLLVRALVVGQTIAPPGELPDAARLGALVEATVRLGGAALLVTAALAVPAALSALVVDVSIAWLNRALPSLQATFLSMPARALVGWTVLAGVVAASMEAALPLPDAFLARVHEAMGSAP